MGYQCFDSCIKDGKICNCHITVVKSMLNTATMACMEKPAK